MSIAKVPMWKAEEIRNELGDDASISEAVEIIERDFPTICFHSFEFQRIAYKARASFLKAWNDKSNAHHSKKIYCEHFKDMQDLQNAYEKWASDPNVIMTARQLFNRLNKIIMEVTQVNSVGIAF